MPGVVDRSWPFASINVTCTRGKASPVASLTIPTIEPVSAATGAAGVGTSGRQPVPASKCIAAGQSVITLGTQTEPSSCVPVGHWMRWPLWSARGLVGRAGTLLLVHAPTRRSADKSVIRAGLLGADRQACGVAIV